MAGSPTTVQNSSVRQVSDPEVWDSALQSASGTSLLQSWQWGEFKRSSGWLPHRLAAEGQDGQSAYAQVLLRKLPGVPISIAYLPRGPIYPLGNALQIAHNFWDSVHKVARGRGAVFLKVEPNIILSDDLKKADVDRAMQSVGFEPAGRLQPARTIVLDITQSEDELLKAMKPKTRYNLRLAQRRGVEIREAGNSDDLKAFYSLLQTTGARDEFGIHAFEYYEQMWQNFGPGGTNSLLLLLAEHPDHDERAQGPIAGLLALRFGGEAIYMYGASANRGREHMPTYLLQWEAVKWARAQGCWVYDFWGIPDALADEDAEAEVSPTNTRSGLRGVYWFKKGFGGREVEYPGAYDYVYNPTLYRLWMRWRGANLG